MFRKMLGVALLATAMGSAALAQDAKTIGVSIPAADHGWTAGVVYHAERVAELIRKEHPGAPMSVFGHADPVSDDSFNKELSGHRADSVYGVLVRGTARWERLYKAGGQAEGWGIGSIQTMLNALGFAAGPVTGAMNPTTRKAVPSHFATWCVGVLSKVPAT